MNFECQSSAISNLQMISDRDFHGIIIQGPSGSGKTYLAKHFAYLKGNIEFHKVNPSIGDIKEVLDKCIYDNYHAVICIENLDEGVQSCANPLLKTLEECPSNIYIVITCNNLSNIPDTIISRCFVVCCNNPTRSDLVNYGIQFDATKHEYLKDRLIYKTIFSFSDIHYIYKLSLDSIKYMEEELPKLLSFKDSVSTITWKLQHSSDNSEIEIKYIICYIKLLSNDISFYKKCLNCLNELDNNSISTNAVLSKFVFDSKYLT